MVARLEGDAAFFAALARKDRELLEKASESVRKSVFLDELG